MSKMIIANPWLLLHWFLLALARVILVLTMKSSIGPWKMDGSSLSPSSPNSTFAVMLLFVMHSGLSQSSGRSIVVEVAVTVVISLFASII